MKATQLRLKDHTASPAKIANFLKKYIAYIHHPEDYSGNREPTLQDYLILDNC